MANRGRLRKGEEAQIYNGECPFSKGCSDDDTTKTVAKLPGVPLWLTIFVFHGVVVLCADLVNRPFFSPSPKNPTLSSAAEFAEERARKSLEVLAGFGQRTVGSYENENLAKDFFFQKAKEIVSVSAKNHKVEVEVQTVSGSFDLEFLGDMYNVYENVQNVIVKLGPAKGANNSLLVNCHYDSFINSPGAGDDLTSCCVMLEALRALSRSHTPLTHNILFLFNGAEENLLQGSHGFITQHRWAEEVRAFVNLEAAGSGGRELVFQTGPGHPWLVRAYAAAARYPFASTAGQEIFQSGLVPGDTDFRVFRDHGSVPGLDLAYISNGYVYHTKFDTPEKIPKGTMQRAGENLMGLLTELGNSPLLPDPLADRHGAMVFFDLGSQFMVVYPQRLGIVLNTVTVFIVLYGIFTKVTGNGKSVSGVDYLKLLTSAAAAILVTWLLALVTTVTMALFVTGIGRSMSWYSNTSNVGVLFVLPAVMVCLGFHSTLRQTVFKSHNPWLLESVFFEASLSLWSFITITVTWSGLCSAYLPMLFVLFPVLIRDKLLYLFSVLPKDRPVLFLTLHVMGLLVPTICGLYVVFSSLELFIPIMGRIGQVVPPDLTVGMLTSIGVIPCVSFSVGLVYVTDSMKVVLKAMGAVVVVGLTLIAFTPFGFPYRYSPTAPVCHRHSFIHIERNFYGLSGELSHSDAGVLNMPLDYNGDRPLQEYVPVLSEGKAISCEGPYCGIPLYFPVIGILQPQTMRLLPGSRLEVEPRLQMDLVGRRWLENRIERLSFSVTGPDHITMYIATEPHVTLTGWSLAEGRPLQTKMPSYVNRTNYFVYYSYAKKPSKPWQFYLDLQVPESYIDGSPKVEVAFSGHYIHGKYNTTADMEDIFRRLPQWSCIMSFVSTYDNWVF